MLVVRNIAKNPSFKLQRRTEVLELAALRVVQLCALDDDGVRGQVHAPRQGRSRAQHLPNHQQRLLSLQSPCNLQLET